jgi:LysM repeat protein
VPLPTVTILGLHIVRGGDTLFCIARGYGVLPAAIAQANGLTTPFTVVPGQTLKIPAVQWTDIIAGPVCAPQFQSPYPGLPVTTPIPPTATAPAGPVATSAPPTNPPPTAAPLTLTLHFQCLTGCDGGDTYVVRISAEASGGRAPYTFAPAQVQDLTFPHCIDQSGTVMVTDADGKSLTSPWTQHDPSCPTP